MALKNLYGWNEELSQTSTSCGASCGASDEEAPAACGAADEEKPTACGSACGAGE